MVSFNGEQQQYNMYQGSQPYSPMNQQLVDAETKADNVTYPLPQKEPEKLSVADGPVEGNVTTINKDDRNVIDTIGGQGGIHHTTDNSTTATGELDMPGQTDAREDTLNRMSFEE